MKDRFANFTAMTNRINRNVYRIKFKALEGFDIKTVHVPCLYHLLRKDGLTATELCKLCEEDKAIMSRTLDYLEKKEYVFVESKKTKRYNCPYYLTEKGRKLAEMLNYKIETVLDEVNEHIPDEELAKFYSYLSTLDESLEFIANSIAHIAKKI
ncbi:MAG: hypothetical protein GX914_03395 [Erysipelotrichia bacterium]|nr:hypothetical protein [Erysipelotrichia bacterium]